MATAISKPTSHPPKMKRPPPPFSQPGVNGVKPQPPSSSPPTANKRIPGSTSAGSSPHTANGVANMSNVAKGPLNRTRNLQSQKPGEQSSRMGRPVTATAASGIDNRVSKRSPEPYGEFSLRSHVPMALFSFVVNNGPRFSPQLKRQITYSRNTPNVPRLSSCTSTQHIFGSISKMELSHTIPR